jgi:hypothetical protein
VIGAILHRYLAPESFGNDPPAAIARGTNQSIKMRGSTGDFNS